MNHFRNFVLRSNRWPFFKWIYKGIYRGGESLLGALGRLDSSIIGMFLRTSNESSIPGLSDYDLTITPRDASTSERLKFLTQFWKRYAAVKRILPMLCETDILPPQDLIDYMILGPGPTVARKRLSILFERFPSNWKDRFQEAFSCQNCHVSQDDFLKEAILRHLRFVVPKSLEYTLNPNLIHGAQLDHFIFKIFNVIRNNTNQIEKTHPSLYKEFRILNLACQQKKIAAEGKIKIIPLTNLDSKVMELLIPHLETLIRSPAYPSPTIVLWTGFRSWDSMCLAVVLDDDLEEKPFLRFINDLAGLWQASRNIWQTFFNNDPFQAHFPIPSYPIFVSKSMWQIWMYLLPLEAAAVSATGKLVTGDESVLTEVSPYIETLPRDISTRYAGMLSLRNNWRTLAPANRSRFYSLAYELVRSWRLVMEGEPLYSGSEFDYPESLDLHQRYEMLQQELNQLRDILISHYSEGDPDAIQNQVC